MTTRDNQKGTASSAGAPSPGRSIPPDSATDETQLQSDGWSLDHLFRRVLKNTGIVVSSKGVAVVAAVAYLSLAAQALGAAQFGIIVLIHTYSAFVREIVSFKSWQALIRYGAVYLEKDDLGTFQKLLKLTLCLDVASAIIGFLIGAVAIQYVGPRFGLAPDAVPLATVYCVLILINVKSTPLGVLRLFNRFDLLGFQALIVPILRLIGVGIASYMGAGWQIYLLVWFIAGALSALVLVYLGWRELKRQKVTEGMDWRLRGLASPHEGIWPFVWTANFHGTANMASTYIATLSVGFILGPAGAALLKVAQEIAGALTKAAQLFNSTIYPELAKLASSQGGAYLRQVVFKSGKLGLLIGGLFTVIVFVVGQPVLFYLFGEDFADAYGVLLILTLASSIAMATFAFEPTLYAIGRPQLALYIKLVASIVHVSAIIVLLMEIGLIGAGVAALIGNLVAAILLFVIASRLLARI